MSLPVVTRPYPLGPYSLTVPTGTYFFNGSFRARALIPGEARRELEVDPFNGAWRHPSDGQRLPRTLTMRGQLIPFSTEDGLRADARTLEHAVKRASKLVRDNGDGTSREVSVDGGHARVEAVTRLHYRVMVTLYPTSAVVAAGTPPEAPSLKEWLTDDADRMVADTGARFVFVTTGEHTPSLDFSDPLNSQYIPLI